MTVASFVDKTHYGFKPRNISNVTKSSQFDKGLFNKTLDLKDADKHENRRYEDEKSLATKYKELIPLMSEAKNDSKASLNRIPSKRSGEFTMNGWLDSIKNCNDRVVQRKSQHNIANLRSSLENQRLMRKPLI